MVSCRITSFPFAFLPLCIDFSYLLGPPPCPPKGGLDRFITTIYGVIPDQITRNPLVLYPKTVNYLSVDNFHTYIYLIISSLSPPLGGMGGKTKERATKRQSDGANGRTVEWLIEVRFLRESTRSAGNKKVPKFQSSNVPVVQSSIVQNTSLEEAQYW